MVDEPTCELPKGSSISPRLCDSRTSLLNLWADCATADSTPSTRLSYLRGYV